MATADAEARKNKALKTKGQSVMIRASFSFPLIHFAA